MMPISHATTSDTEPLFVCEVLDADENVSGLLVDTGETKKTKSGQIRNRTRFGIVVYVRLVSGALPSPVSRVEDATARFEPGAFAPTPARLITAMGHHYEMTLLGSFATLSEMPHSLRAMFHPASNAGPESRPVILDGVVVRLIDGFRPRDAQLIGLQRSETSSERPIRRIHSKRQARRQRAQQLNEYTDQMTQFEREKTLRMLAVHNLIQERGPDAAIDPLLAALNDDLEVVRSTAAYHLARLADRLPVAPFLSAIREKTWLNAKVCEVAAYVFLAHVDEVPVEVLLDLYHGGDAPWYTTVHVIAIAAMGHLGERATDEVVALLADIAAHKPYLTDIRIRWSVAKALGDLGARAPVEALISGMRDGQPEVASAAARSLLRHPGPVADEVLQEAHLLSDLESARRIIYGRVRERLNVLHQPDEPSSTPHT